MTNSNIWTKYWQADRTASCFDPQGANYEGGIEAFWRNTFSQTPPNAKCLDLCTGNGAVPLIGVETSKKQSLNLEFYGVDQANINPAAFVSRHKHLYDSIHFTSDTNVEKLPLEDVYFDLVTSQFGVEYTSVNKTLKSAIRVLKSGGKTCFVMHANEGSVKAASEKDIGECRFLLDQSRLFQISEKTLRTLNQVEKPIAAMTRKDRIRISKSTKEFEAAITMVKDRASTTQMIMHANAWKVCLDTINKRQHFSLEVLLAKISEAKAEATAHRDRLSALVTSSKSHKDMENIGKVLSDLGMENIVISPLTHQDQMNLIGWVIRAQKP